MNTYLDVVVTISLLLNLIMFSYLCIVLFKAKKIRDMNLLVSILNNLKKKDNSIIKDKDDNLYDIEYSCFLGKPIDENNKYIKLVGKIKPKISLNFS